MFVVDAIGRGPSGHWSGMSLIMQNKFPMKAYRSFAHLIVTISCVLSAATARAETTWLTNFTAAKVEAAREHKKLLLDFTGSDWCAYCIRLEKEVFPTPEFAAFTTDYVLVRLDYPRNKAQSPEEKAQNAELKDRFHIDGYPTVLLADASGREITRSVGYRPGSDPAEYLAHLTTASAEPFRTH
jgi:protein disulfide-isomerase